MLFFLLHQRFAETADKFPGKTALQIRISANKYKKYTYAEAIAASKALGYWFINQGIKRQDRIAIILENRPEWPIFYFGILFSGATAVPIDPQLTEQEIKNILSDSEAKLIINKSNAEEILKDLKGPPAGFNFPQAGIEDLTSILYTSGTTAVPKGVALSHKNFSGNFNSVKQLKIYNEKDNVISLLPLHHCYPFMVTLVLPLLLGATVTYIPTLKSEEITSAMRETGVTILVGVPQLFYLFHKGIFEKINKLPLLLKILKPLIARKVRKNFGYKLRFFVSGGARLDPKVARDLSRLGFSILEGYGLTETSPVATFNPPGRQRFGSVGTPVPDVEIKISNCDKEGIGEVLIKGPNVMKGYYKRQKETEAVIKDGWFFSGDLGYIDRKGFLVLTGRKKEVIVLSSGKNIYPEEIEAAYKKSPFIKGLCVLGILRDGMTDELGAVVVPDMEYFKKSSVINIREKIKWEIETFSKELPTYKRVMSLVIAKEDLPQTRLGKIKRYEIDKRFKEQFINERSSASEQELQEEDLKLLNSETAKKVVEFLKKERNIKKTVSPNDNLELDLGIDSLGRVELTAGLEKIFNVDILDKDMAQIFTVKDLILRINAIRSEGGHARDEVGGISGEATWKALLDKEPKQTIKENIDLSPNLFSVFAAFLLGKFLYMILKVFFGLKVKGNNNIPRKGAFILCPNHSSYLDAFVVFAGLPFACTLNLFFLGLRDYFIQPVIKNMIKPMRVVPVDPAAELVNAMQASSLIVKSERSLCIFPEGQRSVDGDIQRFKKGIGILAKELNVTLIPVYIEGSFKAWPRGKRLPRPYPLAVIFGRPLDNGQLRERGKAAGAKDDYEAIAIGLREEVLKLKTLFEKP